MLLGVPGWCRVLKLAALALERAGRLSRPGYHESRGATNARGGLGLSWPA